MTDDDYNDSYERAEAMEMAQDRADEERAALHAKIADLELRLHIATETNVADRQLIDRLRTALTDAFACWRHPCQTSREKERKDEIWKLVNE